MKKLALITAAVGLSLVLCGSESFAKGGGGKGGGGGSRGGSSRGGSYSSASRASTRGGAYSTRGTRSGTTTTRSAKGTKSPTRTSRQTHHHHHHPYGRGGVDGDGIEIVGNEAVVEPNTGMAIRELYTGTARREGMKVGDIIMAINGMDTPDYESLRSALLESGSRAEVDFINVENGALERITLNPSSGAIGANVEQVEVN